MACAGFLCSCGNTSEENCMQTLESAAEWTPTSVPDSVMTQAYWDMWNKEIQDKIDAGIEQNRKGEAYVKLGKSAAGATVHVEQVSSSFLFGGQTFLFDDLGSDEKNEVYRNTFGTLFNAATVAFYWKYLEPERGKPRFTADSPYIYRRPAPDPVVEYLNSKNININGHAIIYGIRVHGHPEWMPENRDTMEVLFSDHVKQLASRYGKKIQRWDVVNECYDQANRGIMPDDYVYKTFSWAKKYFPKNVQFNTNECDVHWGPTKRYVEIARDLIDRGAKVSNVGVQSHIFEASEAKDIANGYDPYISAARLFETLDCLSEVGRPIHISEVTVCAPDSTLWGEQVQAVITRNLYRLYFSYPNTMGITWWNMVDGGAYAGEPSFSGLYHTDMSPKLSYKVLDDLINHEWHTSMDVIADSSGNVVFRGFKGRYIISWTNHDGKRRSRVIDL